MLNGFGDVKTLFRFFFFFFFFSFFFFFFSLCLSSRSSDVPLGGTFQQTSVGAEQSHLLVCPTAGNGFRKQGLMVFPGFEGVFTLEEKAARAG